MALTKITAGVIADSTVVTAKIADDAITIAKIADDAVGADQLAASAVVTASMVDNAVTTAKITDANVTTAKIANDAITSALIADDAIVQAAIADQTVNEARMQISNAPTNGYVLSAQSGNTGGLTWVESAGGAYTEWAIKTTNYTASSGDQLVCNHASTAFTITLPAGSANDTVIISNAGAALITVGRNGSQKINSVAADGTVSQGRSTQLVYVDDTIGWFEI